jgi:ComF family protein
MLILRRFPVSTPFRILTDVLFPPVCNSCNARLLSADRVACPACRAAMHPVDEWDASCRAALSSICDGGAVADFIAAWYFEQDGPVRALMHRLKYGGMTRIGEELGRTLGERICEAGFAGSDFVVPLPLHPTRLRERGYNQCEYIARGVSSVTGRPVLTGLLRRVRPTPSQTSLGIRERRENVRGAFALRRGGSNGVEGRRILLVDDVVTTGATMRSCALALRNAGALPVIACAAALAR